MSGTDERQALSEAGEERGWQRRESGRVDVYLRDRFRIRVIWQGNEVISGASFFEDEMYELYTRDLAKVRAWLKK
ncbi:hypothetical protein [Mycobacterium sp. EPa45]|uniref:hypothetical protein n=1 Tax=Mycobacterium sp. EPa45 TaxID=1545728 RepID=UPI000641ABDA|nr:hypothetical protein [Mycobacterium sp. EPa45]AKK25453.1 hypothetical protein AB431_00545 [Mycobacterium sp. EPa45]